MSAIEEAPVSLHDAPSKRLNMIEAINDALDVMLARDPDVVVFGEDVGYFGGVFRATAGLQKKHGRTRVFDTPINECGIIGVAVGMGAYGLRPVPEIQFADYIYPALDQLVSEAARLRYRSAGEFPMPITVRSPFGGGIFGGQTHSQSPEGIFTHVSGLKTVIPSTPLGTRWTFSALASSARSTSGSPGTPIRSPHEPSLSCPTPSMPIVSAATVVAARMQPIGSIPS